MISQVARELARVIRFLFHDGVTVLLIEQNLKLAAEVADRLATMRALHRGLCPRYASPGPGREGMHGSRGARHRERTGRRSELQQSDVLLYLVENGPGRSELELSEAIYSAPGYPSACSKTCSGSSAPAGSSAEAKGAPPTRTHTIRSGHAGPCSVAGNRYGGRSRRRDRHPSRPQQPAFPAKVQKAICPRATFLKPELRPSIRIHCPIR